MDTTTEQASKEVTDLLDGIVAYWPRSEYDGNKRIRYRALASRVLAVAVVYPELGYRGDPCWKCYIDTVPGINYDRETRLVHANGDKLSETLARALFPQLAPLGYER